MAADANVDACVGLYVCDRASQPISSMAGTSEQKRLHYHAEKVPCALCTVCQRANRSWYTNRHHSTVQSKQDGPLFLGILSLT